MSYYSENKERVLRYQKKYWKEHKKQILEKKAIKKQTFQENNPDSYILLVKKTGRPKKYKSIEERKAAKKKQYESWYARNKDNFNAKRRKKYKTTTNSDK